MGRKLIQYHKCFFLKLPQITSKYSFLSYTSNATLTDNVDHFVVHIECDERDG